MKHITIQRAGQICISKVPVAQCGAMCKAEQGQKVEKAVDFTCLPEGRLAEHYTRKAESGAMINHELMAMDASFTTKMEQPRHCVASSSSSRAVYGSGY